MQPLGFSRLSRRINRRSGFSLIELMLALIVAAILFGLVIPTFSEVLGSQRIRSAAVSLQGALMQAKSQAIRTSCIVQIVVGQATGSTISGLTPGANANAYEITLSGQNNSSCNATPFSAAGFLGATANATSNLALAFNSGGRPHTGTMVPLGANMTYTITSTVGRTLRVDVTPGGSIKICDPVLTSGSLACD